jgi:hypothetical protein
MALCLVWGCVCSDRGYELIEDWVAKLRAANTTERKAAGAKRLGAAASAAPAAPVSASNAAWAQTYFESQAFEGIVRKLITQFYTKTTPCTLRRSVLLLCAAAVCCE